MRVMEIFKSLQGEGKDAGRPALFIRLSGCNVHCPFCDTAESWSLNYGKEVNTSDVMHFIEKHHYNENTSLVVITGGEPFLQQDAILDLFSALEYMNAELREPEFRIETSASVELSEEFIIDHARISMDKLFLNISPKYKALPRFEYFNKFKINEVRFAVEPAGNQTLEWMESVRDQYPISKAMTILSPVIQGSIKRPENLNWINTVMEYCYKNDYRFSVQQHKLWGIK